MEIFIWSHDYTGYCIRSSIYLIQHVDCYLSFVMKKKKNSFYPNQPDPMPEEKRKIILYRVDIMYIFIYMQNKDLNKANYYQYQTTPCIHSGCIKSSTFILAVSGMSSSSSSFSSWYPIFLFNVTGRWSTFARASALVLIAFLENCQLALLLVRGKCLHCVLACPKL